MQLFNTSKLLFSLFICIIGSTNLFAARTVGLTSDKTFLPSSEPVRLLQSLSDSYKFVVSNAVDLPNGKKRYKFQQYYNNVPVNNAILVSEKQSIRDITGNEYLTGNFIMDIEQDLGSVRPAISKAQALNIAKEDANLSATEIKNPNVKLIINLSSNNVAKLQYIVEFFTDLNKPSRPFYKVDAQNGAILDKWEGLTTSEYVDASGPGGNEKTGVYYYGKDYGFLISNQLSYFQGKCRLDSPNVVTYDMKNQKYGGSIHEFDCGENTYKEVNGAYSPINDAHYFGNVVFNMFKEWFDAAPLTFKLKMRVHYDESFENAFWDGRQMTFGDGQWRFYPLVSLDVVAHEVSHGFTQQNSDLVYRGQSGGINESFSDMAGEAAEYFMNINKPENERNDWLVGGTISKRGNALRYFSDPTKDGKSIGHAKDYYDGLNVHYSSGVFNRAFYILSHKADWDLKKAFDIFVLANRIYWKANSDFEDAACGANKAATDLEYNVEDVINAFKQVGVDASCGVEIPDDSDDSDNDDGNGDDDGEQPDDDSNKPDPDPADPFNAVKISNNSYTDNLSAANKESKLFYININKSNANTLNVWNYGSYDIPIMRIAYNRRPTADDNDCTTEDATKYRTCTIRTPKEGKYYIELLANDTYSKLTLYAGFY